MKVLLLKSDLSRFDASPKIRHTRKKLHATMQVYHECSCIQMRFIPLISSIPLSSLLSKHIFILCGRHKTSFNALYIVPLSSPGKITGLYIKDDRFCQTYVPCEGSIPGKRVFFGGIYCREWGLEVFWGKCLK